MAASSFKIDETGFRNITTAEGSPVRRDMQQRLNRVQALAKRIVGHKTGLLRNSIKTRLYTASGILVGEVFSNVSYALMHHEGTRPHIIVPVRAEMLRFKVGGRIVYVQKVSHPGTKANPYLRTALREVGR